MELVRTIEEVDATWLAQALGTGPVGSFTAERIGTGQMSQSHRLSLQYEGGEGSGPASVVMKLAASDETSRSTGIGLGIYEREIRFYQEIAPRIGGPLAACLFARYDESEGWFTLVLEDVAPAVQGDQIAGCSVEQARLAVRELARLHAPVFADPELEQSEWLNRPSPVSRALVSQLLPGFFERYGDRISPEHRSLCETLVDRLDGWLADQPPPLGLVHGDFRLDNLLFGDHGGRGAHGDADAPKPLTVVDWQTVGWGPATGDVSYFLGGGLSVEDRRAHERDLVGEYYAQLAAHGVEGFAWEQCWEGYRRAAFGGVLMAVIASMLVERTERGDEMFMTTLARHAQHALDLDAVELLPESAAGVSAPAGLAPEDEDGHPPGRERLWNESWYFDAVAQDGSLGCYVRIGLYPNLNRCWYTAFVCGPDRPTVAVVDFDSPLPDAGSLRTQTGSLRADHGCERALENFRVELAGTGESFADPAGLLRAERGQEVPVELELVWETDGTPYPYRLATRYEIPCRVNGTIALDGEELKLSGAVGQRDHSWGLRDWWSMDWMWMAGHLDDGTHLHAVELRLGDGQTLGVGYVQELGEPLAELERVSATEVMGRDGLIISARVCLEPPGLDVEVDPLAFGPLRLVADDGRVALFPRAMCRIRCSDGRHGLGWMEWNLNQSGVGQISPPGSQ